MTDRPFPYEYVKEVLIRMNSDDTRVVTITPGDIVYPIWPDAQPNSHFRYQGGLSLQYMKPNSWWRRLLRLPREYAPVFYEDPAHYRKVGE
jgi:hypothetical protein